MKNTHRLHKWKIAASLVCLALLTFINSATATVTVTLDNEHGSDPFAPDWTMASDSLIAGLSPSLTLGNFANDAQGGGGIGSLTTVHSLAWPSGYGTTIGQNSGTELVYILPANANGYDITNITSYSGWWNTGRDGQDYRVYYSTVDAPGFWIAMPGAHFRLDGPSVSGSSCNRVTIKDSVDGTAAMAANVYSIMFDFRDTLDGGAENAYTGFGALTVEGTASTNSVVPVPVAMTGSIESGSYPFVPDWTLETPNLITGLAPTTANGDFNGGGYAAGTSVLTDGSFGDGSYPASFAACGTSAGTTLIYTLTNSVNGSDLTNLVVYSGWANDGRYGQCYQISYSTVANSSVFIPLSSVYYLPGGVPGGNAPECRVAVNTPTGAVFAKNVAKIKFDFASPPEAASTQPSGNFNNAWQGYSEIILQGTNSAPPAAPPSPNLVQDILPTTANNIVGDQVVLNAAFSASPPASLQWQQVVSGPATNNISSGVVNVTNSGVITSTLTLNNVQLSDAGSYQVMAVNATNGAAVPTYSSVCSLAVSNVPAAVGNTVVAYAGQTAAASSYSPFWDGSMLGSSLIHGQAPSAQSGPDSDFMTPTGNGENASGPEILTDGNIGTNTWDLGGASQNQTNFTGIGAQSGAGHWVTYTLPVSANGYDITNIASYAGFEGNSRDQQAYTVYYANAANPSTFFPLAVVNYNPPNPNSVISFTRATITPATGVLAANVVALKFDMTSPAGESGYSLYSEIGVYGSPSATPPPPPSPNLVQGILPTTANNIVGDQVVLTAAFSNTPPASLQWQQVVSGPATNNISSGVVNVTNSGVITSTLTLNNVQLSDAGSYQVMAVNATNGAAVPTYSSVCSLAVSNVPAAVGNTVVAYAGQTAAASSYSPFWDGSMLSSSLIHGQAPSTQSGPDSDFMTPGGNGENANGPEILTDGNIGTNTWDLGGASQNQTNFTAIGAASPNIGNSVTYTLTGSANGYDITNITSYAGFENNGRDQQAYTVYYSTTANPNFLPLAVVNYNPPNPNSVISFTRATITPATGVLAANVVALKFDMTSPAGENGYSLYSELGVYGSPSAAPSPNPVVTGANEQGFEVSPDWVYTPNLIAGQSPSTNGSGDFTGGGYCNTNLSVLTDGAGGDNFDFTTFAACGSTAGTSVTYTCTNGTWNLTNIVVYSGWSNNGRDGQFYNLSYSTLSAPATFIPLTSVAYNPSVPGSTLSLNQVDIAPPSGMNMLATNVYAVQFDFTPQLNVSATDNGWSGYSEIVLQGVNVTPSLSTNALLASLSLTPAGTLNPAFASGTTAYNATNSYVNNPVTVAAASVDANATLSLNFNGGGYGSSVTNSLSIGGNTLVLPTNTVAVQVVSQDLSQTNVYTVNVVLQPSQTVAKLTNSVSGSTLTLTWPADHLGYRLLTQTNNLNKGVSSVASDWGTVPGSANLTTTNLPINKATNNAYYRLVYP